MKKIPSNVRREINKMAHERGILFEQAERTRLVLLAEAGQLSDVPSASEAFPDVMTQDEAFPGLMTLAEAFPDVLSMNEVLEMLEASKG